MAEIAEAAAWYAERQPGLEQRFLDEIERVFPEIRVRPRAFPPLENAPPDLDLRRAILRRFPYVLVFLELEVEIRLIAVAHTSRRPGYWLDRLNPT